MQEKRLTNFMCIEGVILLILGLCILILPKLTSLSFAIMTSVAFIIYGICKFICSLANKSILRNFVCEMLLGIYLIVIGILLTLIPKINIYWLIALIGAYLILETASSTTYLAKIKNTLNFWYLKFIMIAVIFISGLVILIKLPNIAFPTVAMIIGACYLLKGNCKIAAAKLNKEIYLREQENEYNMKNL